MDDLNESSLPQLLSKGRPISKGDALLMSEPFAYILKASVKGIYCENCLKRRQHLQRCSRCTRAYYCHGDCQKASWNIHKRECMNLKKLKPVYPPDTVRLLARVIFKLQSGGHEISEKIDEKQTRKFKDLMNHYSDIKNDQKRLEHFSVLIQALEKYIGKENIPNSADLLGIFGRICVNSYSLIDKDLNNIGTGIFLAGSIFDHSCKPNAFASFVDSRLVIRSLVDWPELDFSKVRISYIDVLNTTQDRRKELKEGYYFTCDCSLCVDEMREKLISSVKCGNAPCPAPVPVSENIEEAIGPCLKCGFASFELDLKLKYFEIIKFTEEKMDEMKSKTYLDVCQALIKKQEPILHPLNAWRVKTLDAAFDAAIDLQYFESAVEYATANLAGLRFHYGPRHPTYAVTLLKLGKILLHSFKFSDAVSYLEEAEPILRISHGVGSPLYKEEVSPALNQARMELQMVRNGGFCVDKKKALKPSS